MTMRVNVSDLYAIVDDADYEKASMFGWSKKSAKEPYARTVITRGGVKWKLTLHGLIANPPSGLEVDHINGDVLDNRRCNLRVGTHAQNMANRAGKRAQFRGVYETKLGRFEAKVRIAGKLRHLGTWDSADAAARAYDESAREAYGEFARLNFPAKAVTLAVNAYLQQGRASE